jgi:hypothetical protein
MTRLRRCPFVVLDPDMRFEALPGSPLPEKLRQAGYTVTETGTTQRILAHAIGQDFVIGAGGEMELATAGSTRPITSRVSHAGIINTVVYELIDPGIPPDLAMRIVP